METLSFKTPPREITVEIRPSRYYIGWWEAFEVHTYSTSCLGHFRSKDEAIQYAKGCFVKN